MVLGQRTGQVGNRYEDDIAFLRDIYKRSNTNLTFSLDGRKVHDLVQVMVSMKES